MWSRRGNDDPSIPLSPKFPTIIAVTNYSDRVIGLAPKVSADSGFGTKIYTYLSDIISLSFQSTPPPVTRRKILTSALSR